MDAEEVPPGEISKTENKEDDDLKERKKIFESMGTPTPLKIISRDAWGAVPPTSKEPICAPLQLVMILDTGGESCHSYEQCISRVKELQTFYMEEKGLPDIPWNFLVGGDGQVYEGRGWVNKSSKLTAETQPFDGHSFDMAYIGDFRETIPSTEMSMASLELFRLGTLKYVLPINYDIHSEIMADFVEKPPGPPKQNT